MRKLLKSLKISGFFMAILCSFMLATSANGAYVNGLAAVIDGEPITDYDVEQLIKRLNVSPSEALNMLIREKLEDAQIKTMGISATDLEINQQMNAMAIRAGLKDWAQFEDALKAQGQNVAELRAGIKNNIAREKLYASIVSRPNDNITEDNARRFYQNNLSLFSRFQSARITKYSSNNPKALEDIRAGKNASAVSAKNATITPDNTDPRLIELISSTRIGDFTPIFPQDGFYIMFRVNSKDGARTASFEEAQKEVVEAMVAQEREAMIADYFNKLRVKANIQIIKR